MSVTRGEPLGHPASALPFVGGVLALGATALPALCPFRLWVDHACPLCGMTRGAFALLRGDLDQAMRFHPMVLLLVAQAAVLIAFAPRSGRRVTVPPWLVAANGVSLLVVWLTRWRFGLLEFVVA